MTPFSTVKIRTAAAVICGHEIALIHRIKNGTEQYTLPGGNVEPGESLIAALHRELAEELNLHLDPATQPPLLAVQDQMVSRPGATPPPRKLHLIFHVSATPDQRAAMADIERDDLSDGEIVWKPLQDLSGLHLYPAVGDLLTKLDTQEPTPTALLSPLTDESFRWV